MNDGCSMLNVDVMNTFQTSFRHSTLDIQYLTFLNKHRLKSKDIINLIKNGMHFTISFGFYQP